MFSACESPVGKTFVEIDIETYEKTLKTIPYVATADAYLSIDGNMYAKVSQRNPLVRIQALKGGAFYLDDEGIRMPLSENRSAHVMLAGGFIEDSLGFVNTEPLKNAEEETRKSRLYSIYLIAKHISNDEFLHALISQIYVDENGEIQLIPRLGRHYIVLGDTSLLDERFEMLKQFYREGITKSGWDKYKIINIRFKDQVICTLK
jgi:cell division protein FtsQ